MRHTGSVPFEQALLLDIAGRFQVFASTRALCAASGLPDPHRLSLVSPRGGTITTSAGLAIATQRLTALAAEPIDTLVAVGGLGSRAAVQERALIPLIPQRAREARGGCSLCTRALLLAEGRPPHA